MERVDSNKNDFIKYCDSSIANSMYCEPITKDEILTIVSAFQDNKSP